MRALQLRPLAGDGRPASMTQVPFYRDKMKAMGITPEDIHDTGGPAHTCLSPPSRTCATPTPTACLPRDRTDIVRIHASSGHDRQAHRRRLHPQGLWTSGAELHGPAPCPCAGVDQSRHRAGGLRLRPVHRRPGRALTARAQSARCVIPSLRRQHPAPAHAHAGLRLDATCSARPPMRIYLADDHGARGHGPGAGIRLKGRRLWRRGLDARTCAAELERRLGINALDIYGLT